MLSPISPENEAIIGAALRAVSDQLTADFPNLTTYVAVCVHRHHSGVPHVLWTGFVGHNEAQTKHESSAALLKVLYSSTGPEAKRDKAAALRAEAAALEAEAAALAR